MSPSKKSQSHPKHSHPAPHYRQLLWLTISFLSLLVLCLTALLILRLPEPNRNQLALGEKAAIDLIEIEIQPPAEFDFKTQAEVLALREQAVELHPELLMVQYQPSEAVFGQIKDQLPWWGLAGIFYYGSGDQSIDGPSEESRFLLNPYMLVGADFYHTWIGYPEAEILKPGVALDCAPKKLVWNPQERRGEVTYSANCISGTNSRRFDLISYNARDFNLNYIYVAYDESSNITKDNRPSAPYAIPHYLHQGNSCRYPGGCNNMSPPSPEIDSLEITGFPAEVVVWLWKNEPGSISQPSDMIFLVRFY
jgi:hypothetical protein